MSRLRTAAAILAIGAVAGWTCGTRAGEEPPPPGQVDRGTQTTPPTTPPPETTPPPVDREEVVERAGGPGAATGLRADPGCSQTDLRQPIATLSWSVAQMPGTAQRVDVTTSPEGFEEGQFQSSERLLADMSRIVWEDLDAGIIYYWRVLTLQQGGWVASRTASFQAPICVADFVSPAA